MKLLLYYLSYFFFVILGDFIALHGDDDLPDRNADEGLQEADAPDQWDHHDKQAGQDNHQRYPGPGASDKFCLRFLFYI